MAIVLIIFVILFISYLFMNYKRRFELGLKIPGPLFVPFLGNLQFATMKPESVFDMVNEFRKTYNGCFRLWLGPSLWVFLHSPEQTKEALNNPNLTRAADFQLLRPLIGEGLLISEGFKWKNRRKALNPAFSSQLLESFLESFSYQADVLNNTLKIYEKIEISDRLFLCILDMICETSMGAEINSQTDPLGIYAQAFHDASHLLFQRMVNPLYAYDFIYQRTKGYERLITAIKIIHDLTDKMIKERRNKIQFNKGQNIYDKSNDNDDDNYMVFDKSNKKKSPLLDTLLQITIDGKTLSDDDVKEEVNTFLFAGVDTTKSAVSFVLYNLAKYKEIQAKLYDEFVAVMTNNYNDDDVKKQIITMDHINQMNYLDLVIKESLRYHTTVPLTGRRNSKEIKIHDIIIPENSTIWINMYGLAHDSNLFKNPYEFNPDRFNTNENQNNNENLITIQPYSYLPYSGGLHTCIGKRYSILIIKVIVIKMLLMYELSLCYPDEKLQLISEMVLKSKTGINLILKKR